MSVTIIRDRFGVVRGYDLTREDDDGAAHRDQLKREEIDRLLASSEHPVYTETLERSAEPNEWKGAFEQARTAKKAEPAPEPHEWLVLKGHRYGVTTSHAGPTTKARAEALCEDANSWLRFRDGAYAFVVHQSHVTRLPSGQYKAVPR